MTEPIVLPKRFALQTVSEFVERLKEQRGNDVVIDGSQVATIGALGLQALVCGLKSWEQDNKTFELTNVSAPMKAQISSLGMPIDAFEQGD